MPENGAFCPLPGKTDCGGTAAFAGWALFRALPGGLRGPGCAIG